MSFGYIAAIEAAKKVLVIFGDTSALGGASPNSTDRAWVGEYVPTVSATYDTINIRMATGSGSPTGVNFKGIIYSDVSSLPGNLLTSSPTGAPVGAASTIVSVKITPIFLTAGVRYWIGAVFQDNSGTTVMDSGGGDGVAIRAALLNSNSYASPSASAGTPTSTYTTPMACSCSAYA